jgi:hypothetical protein
MNSCPRLNRRCLLGALVAAALLFAPISTLAESQLATDPLPSWNEGKAKHAM